MVLLPANCRVGERISALGQNSLIKRLLWKGLQLDGQRGRDGTIRPTVSPQSAGVAWQPGANRKIFPQWSSSSEKGQTDRQEEEGNPFIVPLSVGGGAKTRKPHFELACA